jgi:hypothetical protein
MATHVYLSMLALPHVRNAERATTRRLAHAPPCCACWVDTLPSALSGVQIGAGRDRCGDRAARGERSPYAKASSIRSDSSR